jgi:hypothetical protein
MIRSTSSRAAVFVLSAGLLFLAGCGPKGPKTYVVTGSVMKGGKPLEVKPVIGRVRVVFDPQDEELKNSIGKVDAVVKADGTFSVVGNNSKGIPAGKYKIYVYQYDPMPTDLLQGAFAEGRSPLVREVTGKNDHFEIDLDKPS